MIHPIDVGAYIGQDQAAQYLYENQKATYAAYKQHLDATVQMILYIFGEDVFLNLVDAHQHLMDHTPLELLAYLEDTYVTDLQKQEDITLMDAQMRLPYSMDMMMEQYFKNMGTCQFTLASLGNAIREGEMICLCLVQFTKNDDLIEPCENGKINQQRRIHMLISKDS